MQDHIKKYRETIQNNIHGSYNAQSSTFLEKANYEERIAAANERRDPEGIEKGGEGSRGGKVIGHTRSGKPVYDSASHDSYKDFNYKDHIDASNIHGELAQKVHPSTGDNYNPEKFSEQKDHQHTHEKQAKSKFKKDNPNYHMGKFDKEHLNYTTTSRSDGFRKSEEDTVIGQSVGEIERSRISNNIQKSFTDDQTTPIEDVLEKGGKRAEVGEVRMWGKDKWVKHQDGWVNINQSTGKHTLERPGGKREPASDNHISHAIQHLFKEGKEEPKKERIPVGKFDANLIAKKINSLKEDGYKIIEETKFSAPGVISSVYWRIGAPDGKSHTGLGYNAGTGKNDDYFYHNSHSGNVDNPSNQTGSTWNHSTNDPAYRHSNYAFNDAYINKEIDNLKTHKPQPKEEIKVDENEKVKDEVHSLLKKIPSSNQHVRFQGTDVDHANKVVTIYSDHSREARHPSEYGERGEAAERIASQWDNKVWEDVEKPLKELGYKVEQYAK